MYKIKNYIKFEIEKNWRCMGLGILWHFDEKRQSV